MLKLFFRVLCAMCVLCSVAVGSCAGDWDGFGPRDDAGLDGATRPEEPAGQAVRDRLDPILEEDEGATEGATRPSSGCTVRAVGCWLMGGVKKKEQTFITSPPTATLEHEVKSSSI